MINEFEPLDALRHSQYLKAMGITQWVPRDWQEEEFPETETPENQSPAKEPVGSGKTNPNEQVSAQELVAQSITPKVTPDRGTSALEIESKESKTSEQINRSSENVSAPENSLSPSHVKRDNSKGFIKMVNWQIGGEGSESILLLCRHHKDQPAQSFASPVGPSQFMQDFISAIQQVSGIQPGQLTMTMAHLTEAGISREAKPFDEKLQELNPKLILLMGEESVQHLYGQEESVVSMRGKLQKIEGGFSTVVTYHPFELISQPQLKKLALEDMQYIRQFFKSQN